MSKKNYIIGTLLLCLVAGLAYYFVQSSKEFNPLFALDQSRDIYGFNKANPGSDYIIVNFWASWCPPCAEELPSLLELIKHKDRSFFLYLVSQDSNTEDIKRFLKTFPETKAENIKIIWDDEKQFSRFFKVEQLPVSIVIKTKDQSQQRIVGSIDWKTFAVQ